MKNTNLYFPRSLVAMSLFFFAVGIAYAGGDPKAGQEKSTVCAGCHGSDGNGDNPMFPKLAGQYPDYLAKALADYKSGARKNPIMAGTAAGLSEQDQADLAAYYGQQKGDLVTPK